MHIIRGGGFFQKSLRPVPNRAMSLKFIVGLDRLEAVQRLILGYVLHLQFAAVGVVAYNLS